MLLHPVCVAFSDALGRGLEGSVFENGKCQEPKVFGVNEGGPQVEGAIDSKEGGTTEVVTTTAPRRMACARQLLAVVFGVRQTRLFNNLI